LLKSREQEKETLRKEETKERSGKWFSVENKWDIYNREGAIPLQ
jgi:hypothetical protein